MDVSLFLTQPGMPFLKPTAQDLLINPPVPSSAPQLSADAGTTGFTCSGTLCDHADIAAFIPNAPASAWVSVQWLDPLGIWHDVEGWQGNIDIAPGSNVPFKQWSVFVNQYNQGPFRWVVYTERGGEVWGVSPDFMLPKWGGLTFTSFLSPAPNPNPAGAS
jgi:hypothetical protein